MHPSISVMVNLRTACTPLVLTATIQVMEGQLGKRRSSIAITAHEMNFYSVSYVPFGYPTTPKKKVYPLQGFVYGFTSLLTTVGKERNASYAKRNNTYNWCVNT